MWQKLAASLVIVALVGACKPAERDTGAVDNDRSGVDTVVQSETVKDTAIVQADTSIDVDTIKKTDNIKKDSQ
ncbi:MAG: hypothetical protein ACAI18_18070 [Gemmatimonadales bacterium]